MEPRDYKYWAFISYSHQDRAWGNWLHRALETYRLPRRLVGREHWCGPLPRRLAPIFRDRDELPSSADLSGVINQALLDSRYLIVICSPQSASSRWVNEEIKHFKALGRADRVLPLIIGGEPNAGDRLESGLAECLPPAVRFEVSPEGELTDRRTEPIAADARGGKDGRTDALLKLIAGMIGVGFDELKQRERRRLIWQRAIGAAAIVALTLAVAGFWRWQQIEKQHALDAQALKNRIATLYKNGRLELLAHNEARAALYLNEVYKLGVDKPPLRFMLGRSMAAVDALKRRIQTDSPVLFVDFSPHGNRILIIGANLRMSIWNTADGSKMGDVILGDVSSFNAGFSPDGKLIWADTRHSVTPLRRLQIFDAATAREIASYQPRADGQFITAFPVDGHGARVSYVRPDGSIAIVTLASGNEFHLPRGFTFTSFCKDGHSLIAGREDGDVQLLDGASGHLLRTFHGLHEAIVALDSSRDCQAIAAGTLDGHVRLWNVKSGEQLLAAGHSREIRDLHLSLDGSRLMSYASNGVNLWDGHTGALIYAAKFLDPLGLLAAISGDGRHFARINGSRLSLIQDYSGLEKYSLDGHEGPAVAFSFSADASQLVTGGTDGSIIIWTLPPEFIDISANARASSGPANSNARLESVAFRPDGKQLFAEGKVWNVPTLNSPPQWGADFGQSSSIAFRPDGKILAVGRPDRSVDMFDLETGKLHRHLNDIGGQILKLQYDPSGHYLSSAIAGGLTLVWDELEGKSIGRFERDGVLAEAFSADGRSFVFGHHGKVTLWDTQQRKARWSVDLPFDGSGEKEAGILSFSPDGTSVLATLARKKMFILKSATGEIQKETAEPSADGFYAGVFCPDGSCIVLGTAGKSVLVWEPDPGRLLKLSGHTAGVTNISTSADSALVYSAGADGMINTWDRSTGELLDSFAAHDGGIAWSGAQLSPDGRQMISSGGDNAARLWSIPQETRTWQEISNLLRCRVPWRLDRDTLVSSAPDLVNCPAHP